MACRPHRGLGDPAGHALRPDHDGPDRCDRQPDELGRHRLRPDRGRGGDHRGGRAAPHAAPACQRAPGSRPDGPRGVRRSQPHDERRHLRPADHPDRVPAHPGVERGGREDVPAHGADGLVRDPGCHHPEPDLRARDERAVRAAPHRTLHELQRPDDGGHRPRLPAHAGTGAALPSRGGGRCARAAGPGRGRLPAHGRGVHSAAGGRGLRLPQHPAAGQLAHCQCAQQRPGGGTVDGLPRGEDGGGQERHRRGAHRPDEPRTDRCDDPAELARCMEHHGRLLVPGRFAAGRPAGDPRRVLRDQPTHPDALQRTDDRCAPGHRDQGLRSRPGLPSALRGTDRPHRAGRSWCGASPGGTRGRTAPDRGALRPGASGRNGLLGGPAEPHGACSLRR